MTDHGGCPCKKARAAQDCEEEKIAVVKPIVPKGLRSLNDCIKYKSIKGIQSTHLPVWYVYTDSLLFHCDRGRGLAGCRFVLSSKDIFFHAVC